jgi:sec-independent protein translocase protein TatA
MSPLRSPRHHTKQGEIMLTGILQPTHLIVILIVALVFLGPKRLPTAGRALGEGLKEFKESISGDHKVDPQLHEAQVTTLQEPKPVSMTATNVGESSPTRALTPAARTPPGRT